jgi:hypothetical protein
MGKTGTTAWTQIKSVGGQVRLVPQKEANYKKPGPNQRFKSGSKLRRATQKTQDTGRGGRRPPRGRGRSPVNDPRFRRRIKRSQSSIKGAKGK